jgi:hypothetical protein
LAYTGVRDRPSARWRCSLQAAAEP